MSKVLSSISGNLISAASAGFAPTNSADVSAIASAYQVVSSTATQLYAGTAFLTEINSATVSASRAGQAANASMANSAYYDGTGRLISALPDSATVSSIASSYAESAASSKADASALSSYALSSDVSGVIDTVSSNSASWSGGSLPISGSAGDESGIYDANYVEFTRYDTAGEPDIRTARLAPDYFSIVYTLDGNDHTSMMLSESTLDFGDSDGDHIVDAYSIDTWNSAVDTVANNSASWGQSGIDSATVSAIASSYAESAVSSKLDTTAQVVSATAGDGTYVTSINGMGISGQGGGATGDYVDKSATEAVIGSSNTATDIAFAQGVGNSASGSSLAQGYGNTADNQSLAQGYWNTAKFDSMAQGFRCTATYTGFAQGVSNSAYYYSVAQGNTNSAAQYSFVQGRHNTAKVYSFAQGDYNSAKNTAVVFGTYNLRGDGSTSTGNSAAFAIGDGTAYNARHDLMLVTKEGEITMYSSTADTVGTGIMSSIRAISAAATGGGVDSATVSAIASSYAESAVSSKQDSSAMSAYALSSDVSGVIDTVSSNSASWGAGGVDSATVSSIASSYAESAVSSKLDSSASSSFYTTANESGYVDSAYVGSAVDSAVSSKADSSALSSYALSADVSGTVDIVSTQSANWGGSALALSAGAGISLTMVGSTLVISTAGV